MSLKQSYNQYRNIAGVRYECYTTDSAKFYRLKMECKLEGKKFRIINEQFYKEVILTNITHNK